MIVPQSEYHVTVKWNPQKNRKLAHFRTTTGEPHIDMEFPLPDRYGASFNCNQPVGPSGLTFVDEEVLALAFNQIVQNALASYRQRAELEEILRNQGPPGKTQAALAGADPEVVLTDE